MHGFTEGCYARLYRGVLCTALQRGVMHGFTAGCYARLYRGVLCTAL